MKETDYCKAMGKWLQEIGVWRLYATFTFKYQVKNADNGIKYCRRFLKTELGKNVAYFIVCEPFADGHGTHLHSLIGTSDDVYRKNLWEKWNRRYGRCQILPYDNEKGAAFYVAKHIHEENCDWDMSIPKAGEVPF